DQSGTVTFATGAHSQLVTVSTSGDTLYEGDETFSLSLSNGSTGTSIVNATAQTTLTDDVQDETTFSVANGTAAEAGNLVFTVYREGDAQADQTVDYALAADSAAAGSDYTDQSGTLTFATGESSQLVTVSTLSDTLYEGDEQFSISLSNGSSGSHIGTGSAVGQITDDAHDRTTLSIADASATEGNTVSFVVTRSGDAQDTQVVSYGFTHGDTSSGDYTSTAGSVSFATGVETQTITVATNDDTEGEGDESFTISLSGGSGVDYADDTATGSIIDNDFAFLSIASGSVAEGSDTVLTIYRDNAVGTSLTVEWASSDGSAASASDYTGASGTATFAAGVTSQLITIATAADTLYEGDETFSVSLSNAAGEGVFSITAAEAVATIMDDGTDLTTFSVANATAAEGSDLVFTISRSGDAQANQTVTYALSDDSAAASSDYTNTSGTVTFAMGESSQLVTVTTTSDTLYEGDEQFSISLSGASTGSTIGSSLATGQITDDAADVATFSIADVSATEGDAMTFVVTRSGDAQSDQLITYGFTNGNASSDDYASTGGTLTFASGVDSQTFTVATTDDSDGEATESFTVGLSGGDGVAFADANAAGEIIDNDVAFFSMGSGSATEGNDLNLTIFRGGATGYSQTVEWASSDATAVSGSDYTGASGTATFAAGVTSQVISLATAADTFYEGDETFSVSLSNAAGEGLVSLSVAQNTATIVDDSADQTTFSIANGDITADEGSNVTLTIARSGDAQADQTVVYSLNDSGGSEGTDDLTASSGTVTFATGESQQLVTISLNADTLYEGDEAFTIALTPSSGGSAGAATTLTITDDSSDVTSLSVTTGLVEEGQTATFTLLRTGDAQADQTVEYAFADGTATGSGTDFNAPAGTATFATGETSQLITIATVDDTLAEGGEDFSISLSNASTGATIQSATATATIMDNESAGISMDAVGAITEGTAAEVTLHRLGDATDSLVLALSVTSDPQVYSLDYVSLNQDFSQTQSNGQLVTFAAGESVQTLQLEAENDDVFEYDEYFDVSVVSVYSGSAELYVTQTPGTIINAADDFPTYSMSILNNVVEEGSGIIVQVWRNQLALDLNILYESQYLSYSVIDGTTQAGDDYSTTSGELSLGTLSYQTGTQFSIDTISDTLSDDGETFTISLFTRSGGVDTGQSIAIETSSDVATIRDLTGTTTSITVSGALNSGYSLDVGTEYHITFTGHPDSPLNFEHFGYNDHVYLKVDHTGATGFDFGTDNTIDNSSNNGFYYTAKNSARWNYGSGWLTTLSAKVVKWSGGELAVIKMAEGKTYDLTAGQDDPITIATNAFVVTSEDHDLLSYI
ncbi:beta strand repeat-containing protein, partial [Magnetococcus sp. PR-3]|uniref:beta strand repeat-containing protein n=2 Tax=Magnetococcus sp. PR-3 TaxID=3120355 RepID=UPI002FCE4086